MSVPIGISIGRQRVTSAVSSPAEARYIQSMNEQAAQIAGIVKKVSDNVRKATPRALIYALKPVFKRSQELVPYKTGKLYRSGYLKTDRHTRAGTRVIMGYGRYGNPHYAAFVHERTDIRHRQGKTAKFLERPVREMQHIIRYRLVEYLAQNSGMSVSKAKRSTG